MHVSCPVCSTQYKIPPLLRPRRLRCARCAGEWREIPADAGPDGAIAGCEAAILPTAEQALPASLPPSLPPAEPFPSPNDRLVAPIETTVPTVLLLWSIHWILSLLVIAGGLFALWHWRGAIGHHWAPSLRLYRLIPGGVAG